MSPYRLQFLKAIWEASNCERRSGITTLRAETSSPLEGTPQNYSFEYAETVNGAKM